MDELLCQLEEKQPGGTIAPGTDVAGMAFADDLIMLENKDVDMNNALDVAAQFLRRRGMDVNTHKSTSISAIPNQGRIITRTKPAFQLQGKPVPIVGAWNPYKYLGIHFSAHGPLKPSNRNLALWLQRLGRASLKPNQKAELLRSHVIPRLYHAFQVSTMTAHQLREADRIIKRSIKSWLYLSTHTGDQFLYAKIRDGGLGFPCLRQAIPKILMERLDRLKNSEDSFAVAALRTATGTTILNRIKRLAKILSPQQFWREEIARRPMSRGLENTADDGASRAWLRFPPPFLGQEGTT